MTDRHDRHTWLKPFNSLAVLGARLIERLVFAPAAARIQVRLTRLSIEMGLRSAEVVAFPPSRRRQPSPLLKLTQRTKAAPAPAKPSTHGPDQARRR